MSYHASILSQVLQFTNSTPQDLAATAQRKRQEGNLRQFCEKAAAILYCGELIPTAKCGSQFQSLPVPRALSLVIGGFSYHGGGMEKRIESLESEIKELTCCVRNLEARLAVLEMGAAQARDHSAAPTLQETTAKEISIVTIGGWRDTDGMLSYIGRFFIVMGGAYLLRALTEASTFSAVVGITLGLVYSLVWVVAAGRAAEKRGPWNGVFHGFAAALIAYPLIWEAATRFKILTPAGDSILLAGLTAVFLVVACKHRFQTLAWFASVGSVATVIALLVATGAYFPRAAFLIALGVATLWIGYELEWKGLRWLAALAANLAATGITLRALAVEPKETAAAALTIQLLLLSAYFATVAIRTLIRSRNVIPFEVVQIVIAFLVGFVGAVFTARATGYGSELLGSAGLVLGAGCYSVAFAFIDKQKGKGRNFYFYTSLALLFSLTGSSLLLENASLTAAWVFLSVLMGWLGWRFARVALTAHSTISLAASALAGGLVIYIIRAFAGSAESVGRAPDASQLLAILGAAACLAFPLPDPTTGDSRWFRLQRLIIVILLVGGLGGIGISLTGKVLAGLPQGGLDPGILATLRTVLLTFSALLLAWLGRHVRFREWGWLVYPVLCVTGLKILVEDLSRSRPATLFLALSIYGCALILSPRLRRRSSTDR